jgi:hypothetical protein
MEPTGNGNPSTGQVKPTDRERAAARIFFNEVRMNRTSNGKTIEQMYSQAELDEIEFVEKIAPLYGLDVRIHPDKKHDKYATDLQSWSGVVDMDLKRITRPFYYAARYDRDPNIAILVDKRAIERYADLYGPVRNMGLFYWVTWPARREYKVSVQAMDAVYSIRLYPLLDLVKTAPVFKIASRCGAGDKPILKYVVNATDLREHFKG